jgi:hypothetical protein
LSLRYFATNRHERRTTSKKRHQGKGGRRATQDKHGAPAFTTAL